MRDEIADTCALEVAPGLGDALGIHFKGQKPALAQLATQLQARPGDLTGIEELEQMAHKIHGSGAMFGFDIASDCAGDVEQLAASRPTDPQSLQKLADSIAVLEKEVHAAARARGLE